MFCLGGKKNLPGGKGKGIRGEKEGKKTGEKNEGEKRKKLHGKEKKRENHRERGRRRASISLKSPMPYRHLL